MAASILSMGTTFISIHTLDDEARILYSSDSIIDILGYTPDDVVNRSAWEFFHEDELPYARRFHQSRVSMDKAAVLAYCRVRGRDGKWIGCECCFTMVYDVMIVCTSIYKRDMKSEQRAMEAPIVRRLFSHSPADPRYHMLSHLSSKFSMPAKGPEHEPRAALFLNRFTRTLTIMYATSGISDIVGISANELRGRSFYYCIAENCLADAIKCLEDAKANDSIAYLRFWFRDPTQDDLPDPTDESDVEMTSDGASYESEDDMQDGDNEQSRDPSSGSSAVRSSSSIEVDTAMDDVKPDSRTSSDESTVKAETHEAIFGEALRADSSTSSIGASPESTRSQIDGPIELEAVISCTSDGLVVCLRRARPIIPHPLHRPGRPVYRNGLFAAPWAIEPTVPRVDERPGAGFTVPFAPALSPQGAAHHLTTAATPATSATTPSADQHHRNHDLMMASICEQAIFAWALGGINGSIADFGKGKPHGEALPANGLPIWENRSDGTGEDR